MSRLSITDMTEADVAAVAAAHPKAFDTSFVRNVTIGVWVLVFSYLAFSFWFFDFGLLFSPHDTVWRLLRAIFVWQDMETWAYWNIYTAIAETLAMAFLGTFLASCVALVIGFFGARNVVTFTPLRQLFRRFLDILRGVDTLIWALVFVRAVGLGPLAGVLAIFISDTGTLSKLYSEAIENIDRKQVEGVKATGAGNISTTRYGILPQVFPVFLSQSLYFLESNTRSATILGIVGAGGIGMIIIERFRAQLFDQVAFVVLNVLILIAVIDWLSKKIRMKFIGEIEH